MSDLSQEDIERIAEAMAPKLVDKVKQTHHDFWIDPETHYQDHQKIHAFTQEELYDIKGLVSMWKATKSLWFKAFLGAAMVGTIVLAAIGMGFHK